MATPRQRKAARQPTAGFWMRASAREPSTREEAPKPISSAPEQVPFLSGNQACTVESTTL